MTAKTKRRLLRVRQARANDFQRSQLANRFVNDIASIEAETRNLSDRIDDLGSLGELLGHAGLSMCPDEIACYASNSLQGVLALLRDLRRATKLPVKRGRK
jgi:hypothetical protein